MLDGFYGMTSRTLVWPIYISDVKRGLFLDCVVVDEANND